MGRSEHVTLRQLSLKQGGEWAKPATGLRFVFPIAGSSAYVSGTISSPTGACGIESGSHACGLRLVMRRLAQSRRIGRSAHGSLSKKAIRRILKFFWPSVAALLRVSNQRAALVVPVAKK